MSWIFLAGLLNFHASAEAGGTPVLPAPPVPLSYEIVRVLPHDRESFTQGLIVQDESIVETSGLYGRSFIQRYEKNTGVRQQFQRLPDTIFAEGVTSVADRMYVLTWKSGVLLVLDGKTLKLVERRKYAGEGWGITHNSTHFIVSNGSDRLQFRDIETFALVRELNVVDPGRKWRNLNELEFADGKVWANVWQSSRIIAINPASGRVEGVLDLEPLARVNNPHPGESVLNGIAYDAAAGTFWVTGKLWPKRYEIRINWPVSTPARAPSNPQNKNDTHVQ